MLIVGEMPTQAEWAEMSRQLRSPFDPKDVDFRAQGRANEQTGKGQVVCYVDARAVQDRLDEVVGAGNWSFDWQALHTDAKGEVLSAKGTLTIFGISKSDAGTASNFEATLGAVSHCFKRAAVHWGIGRYLYDLPSAWVTVEKGGRIPEAVLHDLRAKLPKPNATPKLAPEIIPDAPTAAPAPRQLRPNPVADLAAQIVRSEDQTALCKRICDVCGFTEAKQVDTWLNQHIRPDGDPRGGIDALKLKSGGSSITIAEAKVANERLDAAAAKRQPATAGR